MVHDVRKHSGETMDASMTQSGETNIADYKVTESAEEHGQTM